MIRSSDNTDPMVLNGNIWGDMSSVNSIPMVHVLCMGSHPFLCLVLLTYGTFLALRMSESALLGDTVSQVTSSSDTPGGPRQLPHVFLLFCSTSPPWESLGPFCAFWTRVYIMAKDCLYFVPKLRWETWKKCGGRWGENWELERKWQSFGFFHSCVWTSSCWLCQYLIYNMPLI